MSERATPRTDAAREDLHATHNAVAMLHSKNPIEQIKQLTRDLADALAAKERAEVLAAKRLVVMNELGDGNLALTQQRDALAAKLAEAERERDAIVELNHGQFLELEYLRRIHTAADQLYSESEEYDFDDGMGRGAPQEYWDALADAFEPETEAIKDEIDAARGVKS